MGNPRRLPVGAEVRGGGVHFRVWAPRRRRVEVVIEAGPVAGEYPLEPEDNGYYSGSVRGATAGDRYWFRLGGKDLFPDPASRFQPDGPHGPSEVIDATPFAWTDAGWAGVSLRGQVLYEMHAGTFTRTGTWAAAAEQLPELARLGVTVIELMPAVDFPGRFGWGYDGAFLFAPGRHYGRPDDLRRFVDVAHVNCLGVILDVVYNHLGPDGNVMAEFAAAYFRDDMENDWGKSLNFDGPDCESVREFFLANARHWIDEYHLDGLRLDATQEIIDDSPDHITAAVGRQVRAAADGRGTIVIHENEPQEAKYLRPADRGGFALDGAWNDDFHHSATVALTGRNEAYYADHHGRPQEFISAAKYGYLLQGQRYAWQEKRRGTAALDLDPWQYVNFLQNHDQVANSGRGLRCQELSSPGRFRAMTALLLLGPGTPLLFQGQEFAASAPFFYFADHKPELAAGVRRGRAKFLAQFRRLDHPGLIDQIPDPADPATFDRCKLDFRERETHADVYRLHRDLLALRRTDPAVREQRPRGVDGAVLGDRAFALRYLTGGPDDRLLLVNLGTDLHLDAAPEPLLAPPDGCGWEVRWSSESREYGGDGTPPAETVDGWRVMGEAAVVLAPAPRALAEADGVAKAATARKKDRMRRERTPMGE